MRSFCLLIKVGMIIQNIFYFKSSGNLEKTIFLLIMVYVAVKVLSITHLTAVQSQTDRIV